MHLKQAYILSKLWGDPSTGQHYDGHMSQLFFRQLDIPEPDINLEVGSASHAVQTVRIMERFEEACLDIQPDMVMVVGDVNRTVACTLVASKLDIKTAHYEAGLRSNDRSMPEEINRIVTDSICEYLFTTSKDANGNLMREGKAADRIFLVGNLMIDTLVRLLPKAEIKGLGPQWNRKDKCPSGISTRFHGVEIKELDGKYALVMLHRPSNVDDYEKLLNIMKTLQEIARHLPVIFPVHPRTRQRLQDLQFSILNSKLHLIDPVGYLEF